MRIEVDDIWSEDIVDYLRTKELLPYDLNNSDFTLDSGVYEDIEYQTESKLREEIMNRGMVSEILNDVCEDYFYDKEIRLQTDISVSKKESN